MLPVVPIFTVSEPVVILPLVSVSEPFRVLVAARFTPLELSMMTPALIVVRNSGPVVWTPLPLYSSDALPPYVGATEAVAVPCIESLPLTVTPEMVFNPDPESVKW